MRFQRDRHDSATEQQTDKFKSWGVAGVKEEGKNFHLMAHLQLRRPAGDVDSILGSGRSPGEENGNPLLYSCLRNPMDREAWWATVHGVAKESDMTE